MLEYSYILVYKYDGLIREFNIKIESVLDLMTYYNFVCDNELHITPLNTSLVNRQMYVRIDGLMFLIIHNL